MATMSQIRAGLGDRLGTIDRLRVRDYMPDSVTPPMAVVSPSQVNYDLNAQSGLTNYSFTVSLLVVRADARSAQLEVDKYIAPTGEYSVKAAIEGDRTLGGIVNTCRVTAVNNYTSQDVNDTLYLALDFEVEVWA